ncbi:hypothetical protein CO666_23020 [Rhizobium chutanense]|uniref:Uncharacterized protein n=1 Tax=Rhizobium chutanense TaxID=2035448 RepID=A0A2A6J781_9HYPH|nr:hypothetical protein CO666_23020 [Rhizobium chutanense]
MLQEYLRQTYHFLVNEWAELRQRNSSGLAYGVGAAAESRCSAGGFARLSALRVETKAAHLLAAMVGRV